MIESKYQSDLIKKIKKLLPNAIILKNDPNYIQGIPDLLVLNGNRWAMLEVKISASAHHQPNQEYYIKLFNKMGGFSSFIFPENESEVIEQLVYFLGSAIYS